MRPSCLRTAAALAAALTIGLLALAGPASAARDPLVAEQWILGSGDPAGVREAWAKSSGEGVVVAVVDSGVQVDHPDLAGNLWTNPGEVRNGLDDDANGFVDDVHGANMLDGSANVDDDRGHGTLVAGTIAALSGNGVGIAGVAPRAQIMPVKISDADGASILAIARAIRYAVDEGARIINLSLGSDVPVAELTGAVRYAEQNGATIVAASGNYGRDIDAEPVYPASSPSAAVLTVTATTQAGRLSIFGDYGATSVDLAAPGSMMVSTARGSTYRLTAGTSIAAPVVAGSLALLAGARPDLPQSELRSALLASAVRTGDLAGKVTAGRLDVGAAMHRIVPGRWGRQTSRAKRSRLKPRAARRVRASRRAGLRRSASNARSVRRTRETLGGRTARTAKSRYARAVVARRDLRR